MNRHVKVSFCVEYDDSEITAEKISVHLQEYIDNSIFMLSVQHPVNGDYFKKCTACSISNFQIESDE